MEKLKNALEPLDKLAHRAKQEIKKDLVPLGKLAHQAKDKVGNGLSDFVTGGNRNNSDRSNQRKKSLPVDEDGTIFCSSLYSLETVTESTDTIRESKRIVDIKFEDLIMSSDSAKQFAVEQLIVEVVEENPRREWESIQFVDGIMSHDDYKEYKVKKKQFRKTLKKYDRRINGKEHHVNLPIQFWLTVEIHPPMDVITIMQLLETITHDETVVDIKFSESLKNLLLDTPKQDLAAMIDTTKLRWTGQCCDVALLFGRPSNQGNADPSKEILKDFANSLEEVSMGKPSEHSLSILSRASQCNLNNL